MERLYDVMAHAKLMTDVTTEAVCRKTKTKQEHESKNFN